MNFKAMKHNILNELQHPRQKRLNIEINTPYFFQCDVTNKRIKTIEQIKTYGLFFDKRVVNTVNYTSLPFGYYPKVDRLYKRDYKIDFQSFI